MKSIRIKHVDAFTKKPFTGNYAAVVVDANGLSDDEMHLIAREMNVSETAFILQPSIADADIQIRWFTPSSEVPLCGHATVAGFHALAEENMAGMTTNGQHYFKLQTKSGILPVRVEKNFHGIAVEFDLPKPRFSLKKKIPPALISALRLSKKDIELNLPTTADAYLYLPVKGLKILQSIRPDYEALEIILKHLKAQGICVFSLETIEKTSAVHSRFFAPGLGIQEDPVTGSANGPLGVYLSTYAMKAGYAVVCRELADGRVEFIGEQGDTIDRPGRVKIRLRYDKRSFEKVSIEGEAVTVWNGTMEIY
ncbi:MAG: PhzF family phenazine biosynthesis protein [Bacteroidota bacterium]